MSLTTVVKPDILVKTKPTIQFESGSSGGGCVKISSIKCSLASSVPAPKQAIRRPAVVQAGTLGGGSDGTLPQNIPREDWNPGHHGLVYKVG